MNNKKVSGVLKAHLIWPLILLPFLIAMTIQLYFIDTKPGVLASIYLIVYTIISLLLYNFNRSSVISNIINYAMDYNLTQKYMLTELNLAYAVLNADGNILWTNNAFTDVIGTKFFGIRNISLIIPEIVPEIFPVSDENNLNNDACSYETYFQFGDKYFRAVLKRLTIHNFDFANDKENISIFEGCDTIISLYLYDETELQQYLIQIEDQDIVVGLLYIDNYEDSLSNCDEMQRSLLMALVERQIAKHMQLLDGLYWKMEKDRYCFIFQHKYLEVAKSNKFAILEAVRNVKVGNEDANVTISIGIGIHADSYAKRYEYARTAIDLALGRGGDQAVIKDHEDILYYGGKSIQKESNTRVRARVKAHALNELIVAAEQILIMGHSNCDIDALGASVGIYRIARTLERNAQIVIAADELTSIQPLLERYQNNSYYDNFIINCDEALQKVTPNTLIIIVDVNRAQLTQCPELLSRTNNIVVIDHHRQTGERIENQVLSYIEPFSSSASEMVTEFFQYINDGIRPRPLEADTMYSGIMVDTNNFTVQTNVRTFEAVAYLKRNGADITRVRKMFRSDPAEYRLRAQAISNAEIFRSAFALTTIPSGGLGNLSIIGAKVANSLLEMDNIKASFVLSEYKSRIYINARSIDEVNVQVIMEKLGGGGHLSVAAAQLDCTIEEAVSQLKNILNTMLEEGDFE